MEKDKKKKINLTLPRELMVEILLRLPVRSVLRFKSVCNSWLSLISDPQFGRSHFDLGAAPTHRLLLRSTNFYIESIDVEASLRHDSAVVNLLRPPPSPPRRPEYGINGYRDRHEILGCCRGLVLLLYESGDVILWNPSTGHHKRLSNADPELTSNFHYGFGYDASTDDHLVVLILFNDLEFSVPNDSPTQILFLSLKSNSPSWDSLEGINVVYKDLHGEFRAGSPLNGALHWLVFSEDNEVPVIIAFDLMERALSEIPLPRHLTVESDYKLYGLRVMGGCLSVCCSVQGLAMDEIWVMEEYKVHSSWTMSIVLSTHDIPRNHFSPICITKDGGIFGSNFRGRLEKLNDKGELLEHLTYGRAKRRYGGNLQSAMYRESLLSLPCVIGETSKDG